MLQQKNMGCPQIRSSLRQILPVLDSGRRTTVKLERLRH
jgi:hypothetical protein